MISRVRTAGTACSALDTRTLGRSRAGSARGGREDGTGTQATFTSMGSPSQDGSGNLYVLSTGVQRVTPPAPVFDDAKRLAELAMRRKQVADSIRPAAMLVLFSGEPRVYTNDVDYQFRQENNLYYLTGLKQKGATLVLLPGNPQLPELLFLPRRNPAAETWTGHMYSPQEAAQASGIKEIWEAGEFAPFIAGLRNHEAPFLDLGDRTVIEPGMVFTIEPGVYKSDVGGFRHSDTVVVTDDGIEILTEYPKDIEALTIPV